MSAPKEKDIARRLASMEAPEPPEDLLEKIRAEIPPNLELVGEPPAEPPQEDPGSGRSRLWLIAASLAVAVGGGFLAFQVQRTVAPEGLPEGSTPSRASEPSRPDHRYSGGIRASEEPRSAAGNPVEDDPESPGASVLEKKLVEKVEQQQTPTRGRRDRGAGGDEAAAGAPAAEQRLSRVARQPETQPEEPVLSARQGGLVVEPFPSPPASDDAASRSTPPSRYPVRELPAGEGLEEDLMIDVAEPQGTVEEEISVTAKAPEPIVSASVAHSMEPRRQQRREAARKLEAPKPRYAPPPPSTGGTAEPNDQPYGDVFFRHEGTNPFIDTEEDRFSTFGLDVDTGSYTIGRRYLRDGHLPPADSVRVEEWVNAFDYGDRPPARGDFALEAEGSPTPFAGERYRVLRFAIQGRTLDLSDRKPAVLTFVVDVSGSMDRENRLGLVKQSLELLLGELRERDRVGLVIFGSRGEVLLEPSPDLGRIRAAIGRLQPGGSTNAEEGLSLGYDLASRYFREGAINRVILCSDGVANVGRTGPESILERIRREANRGIELTTLGFGMGNYNDTLMEQLADRGDGRYAYLDTLEEARRVLVEDLTGTLQTIASQARAQVEFEPEAVERYRLLGYENRDIADHRFRDDTVDAGEIGAGHTVTALYEIKLRPDVRRQDRLATLRLRYRSAASEEFEETSREVRAAQLAPSWRRASPSLRLATLVAEMAEILKGSYWAKGGSLERVFRLAQELSPAFSGDQEVAELVALAGKAARLQQRQEP